ncbi:MAG TPA: hypothetical protein VHQ65_16925, partial [Thermoanaerobaculia bacterium]|nr:hypothetical protein [Thermoanaerobaculia bacterium]
VLAADPATSTAEAPPAGGSGLAVLAARGVLLAAVSLLLAKIALVPVWSWDHFASWGVKARRLAAQDSLDLAFLARPELWSTVPDYPLGVPIGWLLLTLGAVPQAAAFKAAHALAALGLVAVVRRGAAELAGSATVGDAAGAFVAISPVAWDTESLGLADLPLAFVAAAAVVALRLALPGGGHGGVRGAPGTAHRGTGRGALATAGLVAGSLPWVKSEGLPLAALLVVLAAVWVAGSATAGRPGRASEPRRPRRFPRAGPPLLDWAAFAAPAALLAAAAVAVGTLLPPGRSFFEGDWAGRVGRRFPERTPEILELLGRDLLHPAWLGLWVAFAAGLAAAWRRPRRALPLFLLVAVQLALYAAVFFASYVDPPAHIRSAWFRVVAAQAPLAVLALAALAAPRAGQPTEAA